MKKMFFLALMVAVMAGLMTTTAFAQRSAAAKMRGEFGHGFWSHNAAPVYRSTMSFQATPMVETNRSFSYEPTIPAENARPVAPQPTGRCAAPAQDNAGVTQRFSYEPAQTAPNAYEPIPTVRTYSNRAVERNKPSYMYPKTDPRRYGR